ncbi:hypothetical protein AB0F43_12065 [Kribbella sp. NPDC023972]
MIDLGAAGAWVNLLEPDCPALTERLQLPPYGAAVLRDTTN